MAVISTPFTSYSPDLPAYGNPGMTKAHNCTPGRGPQGTVIYRPVKSAGLYSNTTMTSMPLGTAVGQDSLKTARVYAGDATALYKLAPETRAWTNISRNGGYTTAAKERWKSVEFGSTQIFTNFSDEPQYIDMNADVKFGNLTTLVKGRHIATHKGFVILANTYDALDGAVTNRVRWSGLESPADWQFSQSTMADFQDLHGMGSITGLVADDSVYVLMKRGIVQMQFIGAPYVFSFTERSSKGCTVAESVIQVQNTTFFLSDDGFYSFSQGQLNQIGAGKVDQWFLENANLSQAHLMTVVADPRNTLVYWQFVSVNSPNGVPDLQLIYNYATGEWSTADASTHYIFPSMSLPWTIDQLDQYVTLDSIPASPDDPIWSGGLSLMWGMDSTGKVYSFSGPPLNLMLETPEYQLSTLLPNETGADIAIVSGVRPIFEGSAQTRIQVGTRSLSNGTVNWSTMKECNSQTGFAYVREQSRYQRVRMTISGAWTSAISLQIDAKVSGRR